MKKLLVSVLVVLVVIGGLGTYAYTTFASTPAPVALTSTVSELQGTVTLVRSGEADRQIVVGDEIKTGDTIRTGKTSFVVLSFFDNSTSRLDADTEVSFDQLSYDPNNQYRQHVSMNMMSGKAWSRILRLVDSESDFTVTTPTAVATVRGTALNVLVGQNGQTNVAVTHNIVNVQPIKTKVVKNPKTGALGFEVVEKKKPLVVAENNYTAIQSGDNDSQPGVIPLPDEFKESDWFKKNQEKDSTFQEEVSKKALERLQEEAKVLPGSALYGIKRAMERLDIALTTDEDEKIQKELEFNNRRIGEASLLLIRGDEDKAQEALDEFKRINDDKVSEIEQRDPDKKKLLGEFVDSLNKQSEKQLLDLDAGDVIDAPKDLVTDFGEKIIDKNLRDLDEKDRRLEEIDATRRRLADLKENDDTDNPKYNEKKRKLDQLLDQLDQENKNQDDEVRDALERAKLYRKISDEKNDRLPKEDKDIKDDGLRDEKKGGEDPRIIKEPPFPPVKDDKKEEKTPEPKKEPAPREVPPVTPKPELPKIDLPAGVDTLGYSPAVYAKMLEALKRIEKLEEFEKLPEDKKREWMEYFREGFTEFSIDN